MEKIIMLQTTIKSKHIILGLNYEIPSKTIKSISLFDEKVKIVIKYDKISKKYRIILSNQNLVYLPKDYSLQSNYFDELIQDFLKESETRNFINYFGYSTTLKIRKQISKYLS